jgi:hypothetical protein
MLIEDATFAVLFLMFKGAKKLKDAGLESKPIKPYYEAVKQTINNTIKGYNM